MALRLMSGVSSSTSAAPRWCASSSSASSSTSSTSSSSGFRSWASAPSCCTRHRRAMPTRTGVSGAGGFRGAVAASAAGSDNAPATSGKSGTEQQWQRRRSETDRVWCDPRRVRVLRAGDGGMVDGVGRGPVVYWCSRDQRVEDNWALAHALSVAQRRGVPVAVAFSLVPESTNAGARQYCFMLRGLREMEAKLKAMGLPFYLVQGDPGLTVPALAESLSASLVVADFSPIRIGRRWREAVAATVPRGATQDQDQDQDDDQENEQDIDQPKSKKFSWAVHEVDAHNIVPVWEASDKQEYAARTIRPKINKRLGEFLTEFPSIDALQAAAAEAAASVGEEDNAGAATTPVPTMPPPEKVDWQALIDAASTGAGAAVPEIWSVNRRKEPGERAARLALHGTPESFVPHRLLLYDKRNDPNVPRAQSGLSPYLNFGQLSAQRAALETAKLRRCRHVPVPADGSDYSDPNPATTKRVNDAIDSFLEELVVRRELSDNFVLHNPAYDAVSGTSDWAVETLAVHATDPREHRYTLSDLEHARTHDELWNAAQMEMVHLGSMHGFLRMYWAKKILEWTAEGPEAALATAVFLNDKYQLDGSDPNGYVGCMWAICGVHDNAWKEREVYGKVRYMNYAGCKRKFKIDQYVERIHREVREERAARKAAIDGNRSRGSKVAAAVAVTGTATAASTRRTASGKGGTPVMGSDDWSVGEIGENNKKKSEPVVAAAHRSAPRRVAAAPRRRRKKL